MKILVAGMGNVLRGDDGFGIRVVAELSKNHNLGEEVDLYEAGIGGIGLVQELMNGYDALVVVDAVEKGAKAGTLFVLEPLEHRTEITNEKLHESLVDMHYADPSKVLLLARALNVCPPKVFLVGCQPEYVDDAVEGLRPPVEGAVPQAVKEVLSLINELTRA
ncbi:MAG TPA: hydrogenase maturation protease [Pyrinomonadaceae bacterium]|nr:hydrogenase maturation protease [Pyrinomonadaceae bacterium]